MEWKKIGAVYEKKLVSWDFDTLFYIVIDTESLELTFSIFYLKYFKMLRMHIFLSAH